ncbi:MAG: WHG domain-containing protein [Micrococcales bacterium]|nr:WHG domain-containing protein [Micrococcales bacterium]MCL2668949.1 WHG domain-containing protein [Micrococcales bacterium]
MPRAGLSTARVVELALEELDDGDICAWDTLTLAAVAARAGVAVPSLYKHVRGLDALRVSVAVVCIDQLTAALAQVPPGPQVVRDLAVTTRAFAHAHPGRYGATQAAWATDPAATEAHQAAARTVETLVAALTAANVPQDHRIDAVRALRAAVHGFVLLELSGGFGLAEPVDTSFDYLVKHLLQGLVQRADN